MLIEILSVLKGLKGFRGFMREQSRAQGSSLPKSSHAKPLSIFKLYIRYSQLRPPTSYLYITPYLATAL